MARGFLTPIDLNGLELLNARIQNLAAAPGTPTEGRIYFDTTLHNARIYSNGAWVDLVASTAYTDEQAQDAVAAMIAAGTQVGLTVTYNDAANSMSFNVPADQAAGTASLRTLGTTGTQAAAGNDSRLSDARNPIAGSVTNSSVASNAAISSDKLADGTTNGVYTLAERTKLAGVSNDAAAGTASQRTLGVGATQAAAGNDARLSDARNPIAGSVTNSSVSNSAAISSDKLADGTTNGVYTLTERAKLAGVAPNATNYTNANAQALRLDQFAAPTNPLNVNGQRVIGGADPTANTDLVTKQYADGLRQGISVKDPVAVTTTANVTLSGEQTIDGVLTAGSRVLVKNQTTASQNGIYVTASGAWVRATDADVSAELPEGAAVWVQGGTSQGNTRWVNTTSGGITLGTTPLTFTQDFAATSTTAGAGLTATGNAFNVGAGTGISVASDSIAIDTSVVARKSSFTIGDGTATAFNLVHNLNTRNVNVQVFRNSTPWDEVEVDITRPDVNTVTVTFGTAPAASAFAGIVVG